VTEETGINTIERRIALRLAFKLCTGIKSEANRRQTHRGMRLITMEELVRNGVVLVNKRRGKCNLGKEIQYKNIEHEVKAKEIRNTK